MNRRELLSQLRDIDELDFEYLVSDLWDKRGWKTTVTSGSNDRGIDVIAEKNNPFSQKHLIQAKRYSASNKIGGPDIQQYSSLRRQEDDVDAVVVVTTSSFSSQAQQRATELNVKLVDGEDLCSLILKFDSHDFISNYVNLGAEVGSGSTNSTNKISEQSESTTTTSKSDSKSSTIPDRYDKKEETTELGVNCPICGGSKSTHLVESTNTGEMIICKYCDAKWKRKQE